MTQEQILETALRQSAIDAGCKAADFLRSEPVMVQSAAHPQARRYLTLPFSCNLISYGYNVVASVSEAFRNPVWDYLCRYTPAHCFETPNLHRLNDALQPMGERACFMAEYFLPQLSLLTPLSCPYELRLLEPPDFDPLYTQDWSNALCAQRRQLDILGIGAYDRDKLVGLAACSADCDSMWQIGVDVLPGYRHQGVASAMVSHLTLAILERERVPFYCAAWSNLASVRNALRCGFRPVWTELTFKSAALVDQLNGEV